MKIALSSCLAAAAFALLLFSPAAGQEKVSPYGVYRKGQAEGGYGEKRPVKTAGEASKVLREHFAGKGVEVGSVKEKELFFEAEILDMKGRLVDKVVVDKRTGRIRSIY
jgi:hypothetical protein